MKSPACTFTLQYVLARDDSRGGSADKLLAYFNNVNVIFVVGDCYSTWQEAKKCSGDPRSWTVDLRESQSAASARETRIKQSFTTY